MYVRGADFFDSDVDEDRVDVRCRWSLLRRRGSGQPGLELWRAGRKEVVVGWAAGRSDWAEARN